MKGFSVHPSYIPSEPPDWYRNLPIPIGWEKTGEFRVPDPDEDVWLTPKGGMGGLSAVDRNRMAVWRGHRYILRVSGVCKGDQMIKGFSVHPSAGCKRYFNLPFAISGPFYFDNRIMQLTLAPGTYVKEIVLNLSPNQYPYHFIVAKGDLFKEPETTNPRNTLK